MFSIEDTKQLVESINFGSLTEEELDTLVGDVHEKLERAFNECATKAKEQAVAECGEQMKQEKAAAYNEGYQAAKAEDTETMSVTESTAFRAGVEEATKKNEEEASQKVIDLIGMVEEFVKMTDKFIRLSEDIGAEKATEEVKESFASTVSSFIDETINESMPKKTVVDYDRLRNLEGICESFKKVLSINDETIAESFKSAKEEFAKELASAKETLQEQTKRRIAAEQVLESVKAENLLLKKVSSLPTSDQKVLLESFKGATTQQINEGFEREKQKLHRTHLSSTPVIRDTIVESKKEEVKKPRKRVVESTENIPSRDSMMSSYVNSCKKFKQFGL